MKNRRVLLSYSFSIVQPKYPLSFLEYFRTASNLVPFLDVRDLTFDLPLFNINTP